MNFILLEETDSTNSYVSAHAAELDDMTLVAAHSQTRGRGQRGNSWESEPGKNLTLTLFHRPSAFEARRQFSISEAAAMAVVDFLASERITAMVKWPNDIYVSDRKICGILIEHSVMGQNIENTRIGIGININQEKFISDAPNPVSMINILRRETDLNDATARLGVFLELRLAEAADPVAAANLHTAFLRRLWRHDGAAHPFRIRETGRGFRGVIETVQPDGYLIVRDDESGDQLRFAFKEVEFLLA